MLKIGVVGAGHLGKIHIKCIKELEEYELVGFYDIDPEVSKEVSKQFGIKYFKNIEDLVDSVDVVDVVTPTVKHFECASIALKKHKHVFLEKPIVATSQEARQLAILALDSNVKVQVGHVERFNPAYLAVEEEIENPMFMQVDRLSPYGPRGTDVPVTLDLMIHDLDILLHIVKSPIKEIRASGIPIVSKTADIANTRIEFVNGAVANLTASRISMKKMRKFRIFQHNKYLSIDFLNKKSNIIKLSNTPDFDNPFSLLINDINGENTKQLFFEEPKIKDINAIKMELSCFYQAIIKDVNPKVTMFDGIAALEIANKINDLVDESIQNILKKNNFKI
ncbi:MAG: Gfo/Idh/MocA family protein [Bacteroidales bacterium]|jgi:predicted dehydrogenase